MARAGAMTFSDMTVDAVLDVITVFECTNFSTCRHAMTVANLTAKMIEPEMMRVLFMLKT